MLDIVRPIVRQSFDTFSLNVLTTPTPILAVQNENDLIASFIVSVDAGAANNVFIGNQNVTLTNGLEIVRGAGPINFVIEDQGMRYELLGPLLDGLESLQCRLKEGIGIPFVVWDLSQTYLIAAAATNVRILPIRSRFI